MRKLKPLLAILLAATVLLLSGCANIPAILPTGNNSDFYELTAISEKADIYSSIDINGDNILFLTARGTDSYELTLYSVQNNKIIAETNLSGLPLEYIAGAKFKSENEIIVYDDLNEIAVTYDLSLNQTGTTDYVYYDDEIDSDIINGTFAYFDTYAYSYGSDSYYVVFYDSPNEVYVFDGLDKTINAQNGKKLFLGEFGLAENDESQTLTVSVADLENSLLVNKIQLEGVPIGYFADVAISAINDEYVCFTQRISNDATGGDKIIPYLWKYAENPVNEAFDVKKKTDGDLNSENAALISELESKYGISVKINEPSKFVSYDEDYEATAMEVNYVLSNLAECLDLFPDGFIKEIYNVKYVDSLTIYVNENIYGAGAYASDFSNNYEIVFSYQGFYRSVVFHELMHLIDNRIQTYYDDNNMDFYSEWWALNPPDFEYFYDDDHDVNEEYFVSHYAMTNVGEDMADTFQTMYEAYENGGDYRFNDYEHVKEKAALICEAIRKAFPSMANADEVCWEKYAEYNN